MKISTQQNAIGGALTNYSADEPKSAAGTPINWRRGAAGAQL